MSDTPVDDAQPTPTDASTGEIPPVDEWKPEPRTWSWKDIFTAPMLAFKPKCMLISLITVFLMWGAFWLEGTLPEALTKDSLQGTVINWLFWVIQAVIFGLGASFVSVFMKADLLDDEFLSLKEGVQQFSKRLGAAIMVPAFLVAVVVGMRLAIYLGDLLCSIPWGVGSVLYAILQVAAIPLALLTVLLTIGVILGFFVFPAIVAIRKHSWFDNVIDTFEAVGTKPHILVASIALTVVMTVVCYNIGMGSLLTLKMGAQHHNLPGSEVEQVELATNHWIATWTPANQVPFLVDDAIPFVDVWLLSPTMAGPFAMEEPSGYYKWGTGLVTGIFQSLFVLFVMGYAVNILLAGGMLTYLTVREDDYWDDEDLEDLDQLAKELEEEAKQAEAAETTTQPEADAAPEGDGKADGETAPKAEDKAESEQKNEGEDPPPKIDPALVETAQSIPEPPAEEQADESTDDDDATKPKKTDDTEPKDG